ncbi:uncharacterized protein LOC135958669 [Calliphora vicina]|uniref:uncharacterized protein LOC135958669 n=1 Tax=Calliphora vicina TaxID=7373 RepID=UPI00325BD472
MTENKDKIVDKDKDKKAECEMVREKDKDIEAQDKDVHHLEKTAKEQLAKNEQQSHPQHDRALHKDDYGTQRVYKKTSPNCVLTLYLPSREITLSGSSPSILRGIVFVDPKAIQGYRVYAQLTLTFRYGREDEEVMGLRFCNEAIMSLHQIWPRNEEPSKESLSPLQEALLKRLGDGAHPFTLTLTAQAPPSVQLVPAKRYYGAPIGTSYDVRCFIADKSDEKFHRRASVKMGVRVIYRTDVFNHGIGGPENFAALVNNPVSSPPPQATTMTSTNTHSTIASSLSTHTTISETQSDPAAHHQQQQQQHHHLHEAASAETSLQATNAHETRSFAKVRKSDRGDSFPKLRLSPKTFRFSNRFGRSKSEVEKCPNDPFHNYSKSFQEYDSVCTTNLSGGPQGAVDKPFLLQDGRVGLRASLDKSWYTHGEDVCVTINIRNDSRKTVRKVRVCAIQHVDVCMFNNGKFKNVVADSDNVSPPPVDQHVAPGTTLNTTVILKPQRGATKNWIALEDTLQRSTEPDEITADIAASALRTPHFLMQANHSPNKCSSPGVLIPPTALTAAVTHAPTNSDERNVFAIYVSYYVKVKLTLSGMGGELSLKLPFLLVHIDEEQRLKHEKQKIKLEEVPAHRRNSKAAKSPEHQKQPSQEYSLPSSLDRIESLEADNVHIKVTHVSSCEGDGVVEASIQAEAEDEIAEEPQPSTSLALRRRRQSFMRCESIDHGLEDDVVVAKPVDLEQVLHVAQVHSESQAEEQSEQTDIGGSKS